MQRRTMPSIKNSPVAAIASDTIAAIATAPGRGGIGVIRVSGPDLAKMAEVITGKQLQPRIATYATFTGQDGQPIDNGLVLFFKAPHSFTGEDVLELQGHGGPVVLQMLLRACLDAGARLAEPGEFTRRAFLNGKMDLAQAEAVIDLIDASTSAAARSAVRSLQGCFSKEITVLLEQLIELRALVEATLDFPEEEIDFLESANAFGRLDQLFAQIEAVLDRATQGALLQSGLHVVLVGQPNVGKSSLLNSLSGDDLAIVTAVAGTTRDIVRSTLNIEGIPLHIIDTAGLRDTSDEVERIGIERTWREIEKADVAVVLVDAGEGITQTDLEFIERLPSNLIKLTVRNKIDLLGVTPKREDISGGTEIWLSAKQSEGVDLLRQELLKVAGWHPTEDLYIARERHLRALHRAREHILAAKAQLPALELFAEELRFAQTALGEITGVFTADDLLGEIFGRFCIGK